MAMSMVVLVLLGLVERVVHQNGGKAGKEKTREEMRMRASGVETRKQWSRGECRSNGERIGETTPPLPLRYQKGLKGVG